MRLINADAIVHYQTYDDEHEEFPEHESTIADFLDEMTDEGCPNPVDAVTVKHGRWQWISSTYDRVPCEKRYWCSKCHHETITHDSEPWEKFCPNCGARMDGNDGDQA